MKMMKIMKIMRMKKIMKMTKMAKMKMKLKMWSRLPGIAWYWTGIIWHLAANIWYFAWIAWYLGKPLRKKSTVQTVFVRKGGGLKTHSKWNVGVPLWFLHFYKRQCNEPSHCNVLLKSLYWVAPQSFLAPSPPQKRKMPVLRICPLDPFLKRGFPQSYFILELYGG